MGPLLPVNQSPGVPSQTHINSCCRRSRPVSRVRDISLSTFLSSNCHHGRTTLKDNSRVSGIKKLHTSACQKKSLCPRAHYARAQVQKSRRGTGRIRRSDSATKVFSKRTDVTETLKDNSTLGECVLHSRLWSRLEGCAIQL